MNDKHIMVDETDLQLKFRKLQEYVDFHEADINDEHYQHRVNAQFQSMNTVLYITKFENPFKIKHIPRRISLQSGNKNEKFTDIIFPQQEEELQILEYNPGSQTDRCKSVQPKLKNETEMITRKISFRKAQNQVELNILQQNSSKSIEEQDELSPQDDEDDGKEMTEEEAKKAALYKWAQESFEYSDDKTYDDIMSRVEKFTVIAAKDEPRTDAANKDGGKQCKNKRMVKTIRAIGKQIIKDIGKKLLSGSFNLNSVAFPIRAMIPKSALEKALQATCLFPLYINKAAQISDPVERIKFIICATIGNFYINCSFLKPLNPILGESIQATYPDGTQLYAEQITHHPPMSYFLVFGPQQSYKFYGHYNYQANAGLNSLSLKNKGKRVIQFRDGQTVEYNFATEEYCGSFWGPMKLEATGKMIFTDKVNKIVAEMNFDNVRWKPTDYFQGEIKVNGKRVSKIYGSYMGFIEFDSQRYWDFRYVLPYQFQIQQQNELMKSDHQHRADRKLLLKSKVDEAQKEKDVLENLQRQDKKNRDENQKLYSKK